MTVLKSERKRRWLAPLGIVLFAILASAAMLMTGPKATRTPPPRSARLVEIVPVHLADQRTVVEVMGTVLAEQEIQLTPRVSGAIVKTSPEFIPGGFFRKGDLMVQIDPADYELQVRQRASALAQAEVAYRLELGNQDVARREYELLGETIAEVDRDLVLRTPQLEAARVSVDAAQAALEAAELALSRTRIVAPFNGVLRERAATLGAVVGTGSPLGRFAGTDVFWVEASVPVDELRWIVIPRMAGDHGASARVTSETAWGKGIGRTGSVIRLRAGLEEQGRMARILIAVPDPLGMQPENQGTPRMILSTYVGVEIEGRTVPRAALIPRAVLRQDNTVWLAGADDRLEIRPVDVLFRGAGEVVASGLSQGERLVTTDLSAPVEGMPLRIEGAQEGDGTAITDKGEAL